MQLRAPVHPGTDFHRCDLNQLHMRDFMHSCATVHPALMWMSLVAYIGGVGEGRERERERANERESESACVTLCVRGGGDRRRERVCETCVSD